MPDPLTRDFDDSEPRSNSSGDYQNLDKMPAYQAPLEDPIRKGELRADRQLPEGGIPRLNRTARQVGGAVGRVVSQARRAPDSARQGLHLVRDRAQEIGERAVDQVSSSASGLAGNAEQRARELGEAASQMKQRAQERVGEFMDMAEERGRVLLDKADELTSYVSERTNKLRQELGERTHELQAEARLRAQELRLRSQRLVRERPLETIGCIAGAAFILGVSLRIVRSRHASRY